MGKVTFKLNNAGTRDIRYWDSTARVLEAIGYTIAETANNSLKLNGPTDRDPGYVLKSQPGNPNGTLGRWRVSVAAVTPHAIRHNAIHQTLVKALNGASS
jgi:hypothetical protein